MNFAELTEFNKSWQDPKVEWYPRMLHVQQQTYPQTKQGIYFLLHLDGYLFYVAQSNNHIPKGSKQNVDLLFIIIAVNVSATR